MSTIVRIAVFLALLMCPFTVTNAEETQTCLACHRGIERINNTMDLDCVTCHEGNDAAEDRESAHRGMLPNPGDLRVVDRTCGPCHEEIVDAVKKSLHATSAGIISGARYLWGAQDAKDAVYANFAVEDDDGHVPAEKRALRRLERVPTFAESGEHVDDYLRNQCLRCHLWSEGAKRRGDYRSSGCSACHVLYGVDGLSQSADPTIPKDEPGHPLKHEITTKIPPAQCNTCHNRGDRIGVSFIGTMEADPYGSPWQADGTRQPTLHGKYYNFLQPDIHYEKGLACIDCHTALDLHGDGNIYGKKEDAIEIECTDCHGTPDRYTNMKTSAGNDMLNLERQSGEIDCADCHDTLHSSRDLKTSTVSEMPDLERRSGDVVLTAKLDGKKHTVPQLRALLYRDERPVAMQIDAHMEKLECFACHDVWAPQCYGCHAKRDDRKKGLDLLTGVLTTAQWEETRSYLRWENPVLGMNNEGKVSPYIPGCQVLFTYINGEGETIEHNKVFTTAAGLSGISQNPLRPHTTRKEARSCEDCHNNRKTLGLGTGLFDPRAVGIPLDFDFERIVDEDGEQIQDTSHTGARPFNRGEIERISRIGICVACHSEMDADFWGEIVKDLGRASDSKDHERVIKTLFLNGNH